MDYRSYCYFVSVLFHILRLKSFRQICCFIICFDRLLLLRRWLEGGNLTEEFAMPLICIALYLFISMLRADSFERWKILLCGLTFGLSLMLRPNMFSVWFVFSVYIVINSLIKKTFQNDEIHSVFRGRNDCCGSSFSYLFTGRGSIF